MMQRHNLACNWVRAQLQLDRITCKKTYVLLPHLIINTNIVLIIHKFGGFVPLTTLKHHFNVSNSYVVYKLRLILFPWRHKPWTRRIRRSDRGYGQDQSGSSGAQGVQGAGEWMPPRDDINSPDLYIPRTHQPPFFPSSKIPDPSTL